MRKYSLTLVFIFMSFIIFGQISQIEKEALISLYQSTNGQEWNRSWDLNTEVITWDGITIQNGHVTELKLLFNNLNGKLPEKLGDLKSLKVLELSFNRLSGEIPESVGALPNLEILSFNGNLLTGNIPSSIGALKKLKELHLSSNLLTGSIPSSFNQLNELEIFNVFQNRLSGTLPVELSKSKNLKQFIVAENKFKDNPEISNILLSNSASLDLKENTLQIETKPVITIETSDDEN